LFIFLHLFRLVNKVDHFATSAALKEVCALLSVVLIFLISFTSFNSLRLQHRERVLSPSDLTEAYTRRMRAVAGDNYQSVRRCSGLAGELSSSSSSSRRQISDTDMRRLQ